MKRKYFKEEKKSVPVSWVNTLSPTELNSSSRRGMWKDPLLVRRTGTSAVRSMDCLLGPSSESEGHSVLSNSLWRHGLYSPWNSPGQNTGVGSLSHSPGDLPNTGIEPRSPALQVDSLWAEPQGKPKNTGAGSLSLLQGIFLTQESNWDLLHCRRILYQLSYQRSPDTLLPPFKYRLLKSKLVLVSSF